MESLMNAIKYIVKQQETVIGPVAIELANHVKGLHIDPDASVHIEGDPKEILTGLVKEYENLFGKASIEVCKDAVREIKPPISSNELPEILQ